MPDITRTPAEQNMVRRNKQIDQEQYAQFQEYVNGRVHKIFDGASALYNDTAREMFGADANVRGFEKISVLYSQFYKKTGHNVLADYEESISSIKFYRPSYQLFKRMNEAAADVEKQERLRKRLDTIIGHELGHELLSFIKSESMRINASLYQKQGAGYPKWFEYSGEGKRLEESMAEVIGTYLCAKVNNEESDSATLARTLIDSVYKSATGSADLHKEYYNEQDFKEALKRLGLEQLADNGYAKEYSDEQAIRAGRRTLGKYCKENQSFLVFYCMPRLGMLLALADHPNDSLPEFIKRCIDSPSSLGIGVSNYILDHDGEVSGLEQSLKEANMRGRNEILYKKFSEIAEKVAAEAYLRYGLFYGAT